MFLKVIALMSIKIILNIISNEFICLVDDILTSTTNPGQSGPGSNGIEGTDVPVSEKSITTQFQRPFVPGSISPIT